jgi:hypothetical protein
MQRKTDAMNAIVLTAILGFVLFSGAAYSQDLAGGADDSRINNEVLQELAMMGKRGEVVAQVRQRTLAVLETNDACAEWYRESNSDVAGVFRSLHYRIEDDQPSYTLRKKNAKGVAIMKSPWGAQAIQYGGRESTVRLNKNGPFFQRVSRVLELDRVQWVGQPVYHALLGVASFAGDTIEAQITILLHELAHVIGRIPLDTDSWDGQSSRNTLEVLRHCKPEIHEASQKRNWQRGN